MPDIQGRIKKAEEALNTGRLGEAETELSTLLDRAAALEPGDKGRALYLRGVLRYQQGRFDDAVTDLEQAEKLFQSVYGEKHASTASATMFLARSLVARGDIVPGCNLGHTALKIMEEILPADAPRIAEACFLLSQAEYQLHDLDTAEALTRRAMIIWEKQQGCECMAVSTCLNNLGRIYEERGMLAAGIKFHQQALAMRRKLLGDHEETAFSMGNLGTALAMNKQWEEAMHILAECVTCYERVGTKDSFKVAGYKQNLEICRKAFNDSDETAFK